MSYSIEDETFDSFEEMQEHHRLNQSWYERAWDSIYHPIYMFFVWTIWDKIKPSNFKHWYQRARYGYSFRDTWDIHYYLGDIIPKMIRDMAQDINGVPGEIADRWNDMATDEDNDNAMNEWKDVLNSIAYTFELEQEISNDTLYDCGTDKEQKKRMQELIDDGGSFDGCRIMTTAEQCARTKGWKLFQRYFHNLWD